jgi:hypothetical protein
MYNLDRKYSFYGINKAAMLAGYKQALGFTNTNSSMGRV